MVRIVPDSNVVISAYHFRGTPARFIELAVVGDIEMATSDFILGEVRRNLRDKFNWSEERLNELESVITSFARKVSPSENVDAVKTDPTDNRILECALAAKADFVVTGDNHLLKLKQFEGIQIVKPADFLRTVARGGERGR